ncbi:hypothetical protein AB0I35_21615 [Nocardia sp. NPDC050378]|uniref:hypothetical protein n=1 Tax=Nocardia sp. NPDC050378 TaxID=3155400 RepID=UPI0033D9008B
MPELIAPDVRWRTAWLDAHDEWGPGTHEDGFGLSAEDEVDSARTIERNGGVLEGMWRPTSGRRGGMWSASETQPLR